MKKKLTTVLAMFALIVCTGTVQAQDQFLTLGVKAGANYSSFSGDISKTNYVLKYQFGVTADLAFSENIYLLTGLELQTKGTKSKPKSAPNVKYNPMYLQLPVHFGYKFDIAPGNRLVLQAGPYVAYGIAGKMKESGSKKVSVFHDDRFKRFDFGLGGAVGWEFNHFVVKTGYDFGLVDICDVKGIKARNQNAYLTLGYRF